ncbi:hypothetical protein LMG8286_01655 [Campylobacter suis]|uniref:L,D-TPase catalytic domain-containing protein n=1 Tax=Campylobacter suis TaxID=2790657 RepID=A0ABM8Q7Z9_9BACT|nr:hypothetical protein LMG8286_01655 [Campylobacter suis]
MGINLRKIILFFTVLSCLNATDYEEIYLKNGASEVIKTIEKNILSDSFWQKKLEGKNLEYGYYDSDVLLSVVDKDNKKLEVISYSNGNTKSELKIDVIVGKSGEKLAEGDLKTPIGVYELTRRFTPSDPYLGPLAFSLSYPNLLDKHAKRNGSGIWIHGYPLNGERTDDLKTKGCVAMKNDILLDSYDKLIDHKKSLAFIYEGERPKADAAKIGKIFSSIFKWKKAWTQNDTQEYFNFYDKDFIRYDGMSLENFKNMKRMIFSRKEQKSISFSNFVITPYPNSKNEPLFRVSFYEVYDAPSTKFSGQKTLYVKLYEDGMKILVEE